MLKAIASLTNDLYIVTPQKNRRGRKDKLRRLDRYHYREYTQNELQDYVKQFGWDLVSISVANCRIYAHFTRMRSIDPVNRVTVNDKVNHLSDGKDRIVVYTAIFGNRDKLIDSIQYEGVDFVCFTDDSRVGNSCSKTYGNLRKPE